MIIMIIARQISAKYFTKSRTVERLKQYNRRMNDGIN